MMTDHSSPGSAGVAAREPHRNEALADWLEQAPRTMFKFGDGEREIVEPSYLLASDVDALIQMLRAAAQGVPEGWKLVPIEPTAGMIETGCDNNPTMFNEGTDDGFAADVANDVYVAMVRAAPALSSAERDQS